ncbi:MAG: hypothetical protein LC793_11315 [Thermomicrobia bacterium]|nr:hypothetical protein [Thermomicrobia bacterium]
MNAPELLDVLTHESTVGDDPDDTADTAQRGVGVWGVLLVVVIVFGYLTATRRKAIGTLAEQLADIARDFRGYDPEF